MNNDFDLANDDQQGFSETTVAEDIGYSYLELEQLAIEKRWAFIRNVVIVFFIVGALLLPLLTQGRWIEVTLLAWLNCAVYAFFAIYFIRQRTLGSLIPILTPMVMVVGSSLGVVYFAIFYPDAGYNTMIEWISFFSGGARYQLTILLFMLSYFVMLTFLLRPERRVIQSPLLCTKYIAYWITIAYMFAMGLAVLVRIFPVGGVMKWLGDGMMLYCSGFTFVTGSLYKHMSKKFKIVVLSVIAVLFILFTIANARGHAIFTVAFLVLGYLLFSDTKPKTKLMLLGAFVVMLPVYIVVGNTTRVLLGTIGFQNFSARIAALKEWRYVAAAAGDPILRMFDRLFYHGGNLIVASTPSQHRYIGFYPGRFLLETLESLLPGALFYHPYYRGTAILAEYGLMITEQTSTEVSMIGSLWLLGGYTPIIIGGFVIALIHGFIAQRIRRAWFQNPDKAIFYFAVIAQPLAEGLGSDFIGGIRQMFWHLAFAFIAFKLITPFLKTSYHHGEQMETAIEESA